MLMWTALDMQIMLKYVMNLVSSWMNNEDTFQFFAVFGCIPC